MGYFLVQHLVTLCAIVFLKRAGLNVGRVVASDTRGPQFEYNHGQKFIMYLFTDDYCKEAGIDPFFKCKMGLLLSTVNV